MIAGRDPPNLSGVSPIRIGFLASALCFSISSISSTPGKVAVSVLAVDNVRVTKVQLYVDGRLRGTDGSAPWTVSVDTKPLALGTHTVQAKAYDAAGNSSLSGPQTFTK